LARNDDIDMSKAFNSTNRADAAKFTRHPSSNYKFNMDKYRGFSATGDIEALKDGPEHVLDKTVSGKHAVQKVGQSNLFSSGEPERPLAHHNHRYNTHNDFSARADYEMTKKNIDSRFHVPRAEFNEKESNVTSEVNMYQKKSESRLFENAQMTDAPQNAYSSLIAVHGYTKVAPQFVQRQVPTNLRPANDYDVTIANEKSESDKRNRNIDLFAAYAKMRPSMYESNNDHGKQLLTESSIQRVGERPNIPRNGSGPRYT